MLKQLQQVWYDNMQKMSSYIYEEILKTTARTSKQPQKQPQNQSCLLYTSDAADEL